VKSLLAVREVDGAVDDDALSAYLALRYVPAPLTMFRGVKKLPPASILTWQAGRVSIARYWDLADVATLDEAPPTEADATAELRERVDQVTKMRLMSEVPVGAFLSGGLDSTMITAAMLRAADARGALKTFSVGYAEDDAQSEDELAYARLAAGALGTEHHEVRVSMREAADALPKIVWHLDEPVADPACVPLYFLARRAKEEVTVVLSGEGADEALGGYHIYQRMARLEALRQRLGAGGSALSLAGELLALVPHDKVRRAARLFGRPLEDAYRGVARAFDDDVVVQLHNNMMRPHNKAAAEIVQSLLLPHWEATRAMTPLRRMLYLDSRVWLPDDLLVKADKMTMAHAVELRVPFLDHELMEHAWSLPDHLKIANGVGKALLRKAAAGRVPQAILERPKMGFGTPTAAWLRGGLRELAHDALTDSRSLARERFDLGFVRALLQRHQTGADLSPELWPLVVLELWHKNFSARPQPEPIREVA
jgi:asparagine synthase (glutamine-hydrolysing)